MSRSILSIMSYIMYSALSFFTDDSFTIGSLSKTG